MKFVEITTGYPKASNLLPKEDFFRYPCMLAKQVKLAPEIWCLRNPSQEAEQTVNGIRVRRFANAFSLYINLWKEDIALIHAWLRPHFPSLLAGLTPKKKVFTTLTYELGSNAFAKAVSLFLIKRFDAVISITPYEKEIYEKEGINSELIPLAIDYAFFSKAKKTSKAMKKYGLRESAFRIVAVANFRAFKNLDVMVEAFDRFNKDWEDAQFIVVGQDMLQNKGYREQKKTSTTVQDIIAQNRNILWLGHRSPQEIRDILDCSQAYVSSSSVEAQGLTNYEAAASGLPLCLSDIGSFTTIFGADALYHPAGDAQKLAENFKKYAEDEKLRDRNGKAVQKKMKAYDFSVLGTKLINLYRKVLRHA